MAFVVPYVGEVLWLKYLVNFSSADNLRLHLYTNNYVPTKSDTLSNYTEASATGYASISLTGSSWTIATTSGTTSAVYAVQTFTTTAAMTAYGYYITNNASTQILAAERFTDGPYTLPVTGGTIDVTPTINFD
jgi:hypothetical protein